VGFFPNRKHPNSRPINCSRSNPPNLQRRGEIRGQHTYCSIFWGIGMLSPISPCRRISPALCYRRALCLPLSRRLASKVHLTLTRLEVWSALVISTEGVRTCRHTIESRRPLTTWRGTEFPEKWSFHQDFAVSRQPGHPVRGLQVARVLPQW
jgi:hypothetical protein